MVAHDAKDSFVIVAADYRREVYLYAHKWMSLDNALGVHEAKDVESIRQELETYRQVRVIVYSEQPVRAA